MQVDLKQKRILMFGNISSDIKKNLLMMKIIVLLEEIWKQKMNVKSRILIMKRKEMKERMKCTAAQGTQLLCYSEGVGGRITGD